METIQTYTTATNTERWYNSSSYSIDSSDDIVPLFYHQYSISFGYTTQDSSVIPNGVQVGSYNSFGVGNAITVGVSYGATNASSVWIDASSTGVPSASFVNYNANSATERWALPSSSQNLTLTTDNGGVTFNIDYYHQYKLTLQ
jgi:hypothetical protein